MLKEGDPYRRIGQLGRDAHELLAEYNGAEDEHERRIALIQLRAVDQERNRIQEQIEALEGLPNLWESLYGGVAGYLALFSGLRPDKRLERPQEGYFPYPDGTDEAQAWVRTAAADGREVYQCAHLVTEPRRRKEYAARLTALWVDLDHPHLDQQAAPPPSIVVESSPGKLQCYWQLTEPIDPATGEQVNRQLAQALGADASGWDLTQLLRAPGTFNHKYQDAPLVRVVALTGRRYDLGALTAPLADLPLFGAAARQPAPRRTEAGDTARAVPPPPATALDRLPLTTTARRTLQGELPKKRPDGAVDRSASLVQIARVLYGAGVPVEELPAILAERDETLGWRKYTEREDAGRQYRRIADFISRPRR
jgi:hypothetical protein